MLRGRVERGCLGVFEKFLVGSDTVRCVFSKDFSNVGKRFLCLFYIYKLFKEKLINLSI